MTPDAQRIAIAEHCGWKNVHRSTKLSVSLWNRMVGVPPNGDHENIYVPSYTLNLNAMAGAELHLTEEQAFNYAGRLAEACGNSWHKATRASATVRAEAFLRTINKWDDAK